MDAIAAMLRQAAATRAGSTIAMAFLLPLELADAEVRPGLQTIQANQSLRQGTGLPSRRRCEVEHCKLTFGHKPSVSTASRVVKTSSTARTAVSVCVEEIR